MALWVKQGACLHLWSWCQEDDELSLRQLISSRHNVVKHCFDCAAVGLEWKNNDRTMVWTQISRRHTWLGRRVGGAGGYVTFFVLSKSEWHCCVQIGVIKHVGPKGQNKPSLIRPETNALKDYVTKIYSKSVSCSLRPLVHFKPLAAYRGHPRNQKKSITFLNNVLKKQLAAL